jgi:hypothetical protein
VSLGKEEAEGWKERKQFRFVGRVDVAALSIQVLYVLEVGRSVVGQQVGKRGARFS